MCTCTCTDPDVVNVAILAAVSSQLFWRRATPAGPTTAVLATRGNRMWELLEMFPWERALVIAAVGGDSIINVKIVIIAQKCKIISSWK